MGKWYEIMVTLLRHSSSRFKAYCVPEIIVRVIPILPSSHATLADDDERIGNVPSAVGFFTVPAMLIISLEAFA